MRHTSTWRAVRAYRRSLFANGVTILLALAFARAIRPVCGVLRPDAGTSKSGTVVKPPESWSDEGPGCAECATRCAPLSGRGGASVRCFPLGLPLLADICETFLLRPEGDGVLFSPADGRLSSRCCARIEDVALSGAVNEATAQPAHVRTSWAGWGVAPTATGDRFRPRGASLFWLPPGSSACRARGDGRPRSSAVRSDTGPYALTAQVDPEAFHHPF